MLLLLGAYVLSFVLNVLNVCDQQNYLYVFYKLMLVEVFFDVICQVIGVLEKFNGWLVGYWVIELWDNYVFLYFFDIFGCFVWFSVCECECGIELSIVQVLYVMNLLEFVKKIGYRYGFVCLLVNLRKSL